MDEQVKRIIVAALLFGLVLFIHYTVVMPWLMTSHPVKPGGPDNTTAARGVPAPPDNTTIQPAPPRPAPTPTPAPTPAPDNGVYTPADQEQVPVVDNYPLSSKELTSTWSNEFTGSCRGITFNNYYTTVKHRNKLELLGSIASVVEQGRERRPAWLTVEFPLLGPAVSQMKMKAAYGDNGTLVFTGKVLKSGRDFLEITKTVAPGADGRFEVGMELTFRNLTDEPVTLEYVIRALEGMTVEPGTGSDLMARITPFSDKGLPVLTQKQYRASFKTVPWTVPAPFGVQWAGLEDQYFMSLLYRADASPMEGASVEPVQVRETPAALETTSLRVKLVPKKLVIPPNAAAAAQKFILFIGPKKADVLDAYKALGLPSVLDYGWFSPIAIGLLWVLDAFYVFCRNYGVAIILLTILVRVLVHPLTRKSQVAMYKMQKLRPLIEELQKKHKNDKQKLGQEQMKLFREHGANPFSGCLPLLLQMPILFALYWALRITFDLRQQPFVGWISDLSLPDTVGYLPAAVPLLGGAPINVLPLVMMVAMYLQQKMQPKPDDPTQAQQQKFMAFFPFLMGFLFYSFPSGLSLYWLLSTVLGIGEQWLIKRQLEKMPALNVVTKKK